MKYLKSYNESIRSKMIGKSEDDIKILFKKLTPNQKLVRAAEYGILWALKEAIEEGANIDYNNGSALRLACLKKQIEIIKILIDNGANINKWKTVLINFAKEQGNNEVVELLKQYMNKTNESIRSKMTPKSSEDIKKSLADLDAIKKYSFIKKHNIKDLYSKEEMEDIEKEVRINYNFNKEYINKKMTSLAKEYNCEPQTYNNEDDDDFQVSFKFKNNLNVYMRTQIFSVDFEVGYDFNEKHDWDFVEFVQDGIYKINNWITEMGPINESIRDKMLPKSEEEVREKLDKLNPIDKIKVIKKYKSEGLYTKEELESIIEDVKKSLDGLDVHKKYFFLLDNDLDGLYPQEEIYEMRKKVLEDYNIVKEDIIKAMTKLANKFNTKLQINYDNKNFDFDVEISCNNKITVYIRKRMSSEWFEVGYNLHHYKGTRYDDVDDVDTLEEGIAILNKWIDKYCNVNEGIRSKMTGKTPEEVKIGLTKLNPIDRMETIKEHELEYLFTDEELNSIKEEMKEAFIHSEKDDMVGYVYNHCVDFFEGSQDTMFSFIQDKITYKRWTDEELNETTPVDILEELSDEELLKLYLLMLNYKIHTDVK
jgi:hypothetical protein